MNTPARLIAALALASIAAAIACWSLGDCTGTQGSRISVRNANEPG